MAHFHRVPGGERVSGQTISVASPLTLGLWGPQDSTGTELNVRADNAAVTCARQGMASASRVWQITGAAGAAARVDAFDSTSVSWDHVFVSFRSAAAGAPTGDIAVRPITAQVNEGREDAKHLDVISVPSIPVVDVNTFRPGDPANKPNFSVAPPRKSRMGVFACSRGNNTRAVILMLPETGTPDRILIGITHGFGQNRQYYAAEGWTDPLSTALIQDVAIRFVRDRWGAQMLASRKQMAMLLIVRASAGSGGELGPFAHDAEFTRTAFDGIAAVTGRSFSTANVEIFTYSSGIHDLARFVNATQGTLNYQAIYNIDPARHLNAPHPRGANVKQFLSGQTGGPAPGFEWMPESRWENEPNFRSRGGQNLFNYLHNRCLPNYALHLGIQLT